MKKLRKLPSRLFLHSSSKDPSSSYTPAPSDASRYTSITTRVYPRDDELTHRRTTNTTPNTNPIANIDGMPVQPEMLPGMNVQCQCGSIKFQTPLPQPLAVYICHCEECRRQSSSAFGCSAIFPKFDLPCREILSCYSRPTASGHSLNCYFCKNCGTRLIHSTPGKDVVSVKGGCIEGLDWRNARHIWCKRAMVPIPEGVERDEEEPADEDYGDAAMSDGGEQRRMGLFGGTVGKTTFQEEPVSKFGNTRDFGRERVTIKDDDEIMG